ncbi:MAG: hypothetical protein JW923_00940 [Spirochaetales bacterium]|nr:hypothetical protein [Spirochaetales bacterium]
MRHGAAFVAFLFVLALVSATAVPAYRAYRSWQDGVHASRESFSDLRRVAINTVPTEKDLARADWTSMALGTWKRDSRLLALVVRDDEGTVLYALPDASPYYRPAPDAAGLSPDGLFVALPPSVELFSGSLSSGMTLHALFATLSQHDAFVSIRLALLSYLAVLVVAVAWLVALAGAKAPRPATAAAYLHDAAPAYKSPSETGAFVAVRSPPFQHASEPAYEPSDRVAGEAEAAGPVMDDGLPDYDDGAGAPETFPVPKREPRYGFQRRSTSDDDDGMELLIDERIDFELEPPPASPRDGMSPLERQDAPLEPKSGPPGLFDPDTGLGWEAYLRDRLDAELKRSASFEQDICLFIASLDDSERGREDFSIFSRLTQEFFSFKDLSFEFGDSGVAVILPNMDIDHAIRMSEELLKKLTFQLQGRHGGANYLELFMGLSSRTGRLVSADRMVSEAMAALRKAREERDTHIMAFRPDPEKFRAFLAGQ